MEHPGIVKGRFHTESRMSRVSRRRPYRGLKSQKYQVIPNGIRAGKLSEGTKIISPYWHSFGVSLKIMGLQRSITLFFND